jgi:hypothetical protein
MVLDLSHQILTASAVLVFLVVSFLLAVPPISYMHSSSPPFVPHALHYSYLEKNSGLFPAVISIE